MLAGGARFGVRYQVAEPSGRSDYNVPSTSRPERRRARFCAVEGDFDLL